MKRAAAWIGAGIAVVAAFGVYATWGASHLALRDEITHADAVFVFSGDPGYRRVAKAVRVFDETGAQWLIVTGYGSGGDSGPLLADRAAASGVPRDRILVEDRSTDTISNVRNALPLLEAHQIHSVVLVTSPCHQRRAFTVFERETQGMNLEVLNAPANGGMCTVIGHGRVSLLTPAVEWAKIGVVLATGSPETAP